jgi:hypothetical protein
MSQTNLYASSLESAASTLLDTEEQKALYDFIPAKDMSSNKYVKEVMNLRHKLDPLISPEGILNIEELKKHIPRRLRGNNFDIDYLSLKNYRKATNPAIAGGFCRNILMGKDYPTDIDLVASVDSTLLRNVLSLSFKEVTEEGAPKFKILDNTMHTMNCGMSILDEGKKGYSLSLWDWESNHTLADSDIKIARTTVDSGRFDFTINCGSISLTDGILYAPPITLHDIEKGILRHTSQLSSKTILFSMNYSTIIRAIRFTLKYGLKLHDTMYKSIRYFLDINRNLVNYNDKAIYFALKSLYKDPKPLRDEIYSILKKLKMIETENYKDLDTYFNHIKNRKENNPRPTLIIVPGETFDY